MSEYTGQFMRRKKQWGLLLAAIISVAVAYFQQYKLNPPDNYQNNTEKMTFKNDAKSYNDALKILWGKVYRKGGKTLYCDVPFSTKNRKQRRKLVNAEHVFPMSWAAKALDCGTRKQCHKKNKKFREIESDLHNIYPAVIRINKARSNFRFGEVAGEKRYFGHCDFETDKRQRIAEPKPATRGEIARAMLYMEYQYGLPLHKKTKKLMLIWDREDPPTKEEKRRAKVIQKAQKKENPFVTRYPFSK